MYVYIYTYICYVSWIFLLLWIVLNLVKPKELNSITMPDLLRQLQLEAIAPWIWKQNSVKQRKDCILPWHFDKICFNCLLCLLVVGCCCWLLLLVVVVGCCWLLVVSCVVGYCWMWVVACWLLVVGCELLLLLLLLLLVIVGCELLVVGCWLLLLLVVVVVVVVVVAVSLKLRKKRFKAMPEELHSTSGESNALCCGSWSWSCGATRWRSWNTRPGEVWVFQWFGYGYSTCAPLTYPQK